MSIVILVVMFFLAMVGKGKGVVNYKFPLEKVIFTLLFLPVFANFAKGHLVSFVPEMAAAIIAAVLGLIIVFIIVGYLLNLITKVPKYEDTGSDRFMGFIAGLIKGYVLFAMIILIYAGAFADIAAPSMITHQIKYNFINNKIENAVEYYRQTIYSVYRSAKSQDVTNLTSKSDDYYKGRTKIDIKGKGAEENNLKGKVLVDTSVAGYVPWVRSSIEFTNDKDEKDTKK